MRTIKATVYLTSDKECMYTTFFYHKDSQIVQEVITDGTTCALSIQDTCKLWKGLKHSSELPKYMKTKLTKR